MRSRAQFQFTVFELIVLAASFAATSALVFLLGIYVGRDIAGEHAPADQQVARLPIEHGAPIALAARPRGAPELQFGPTAAEAALAAEAAAAAAVAEARLASERAATARRAAAAENERVAIAESAARARAQASSAAADVAVGGAGASASKATERADFAVAKTARAYGSRGTQGPEYRNQRPDRTPPPAPTAASPSGRGSASGGAFLFTEDAPASASPTVTARDPRRPNYPATSKQRQEARARTAPPLQPYRPPPPLAAAVPPAPRASATPAYTVQVLSTRDSAAADNLARSLQSRGYGAYVRPAQDSTGRWYRVRVGRFDDLSSARAMATRCRKDLRLDQAYVISD